MHIRIALRQQAGHTCAYYASLFLVKIELTYIGTTPILVCFRTNCKNYLAVNSENRHLAKHTDNQRISLSNLQNKSNKTSALSKTDQALVQFSSGV